MDNPDKHKNFPANDELDTAELDKEIGKLISLNEDKSKTGISHSPLNLGSGSGIKQSEPAEDIKSLHAPKPQKAAQAAKVASQERITGVKTFFTKLHAGAITFLDEQINTWLNDNPGVVIKRTNTVTGPVEGKKIEHNIIITIWY